AAVDAFQVQDALVAQQVGAVYLNNAAQEFFEPFRIECLVGTEYERPDLVVVVGVVMIMVMVAAVGAAVTLVVMVVVMFVTMIVVVVVVVGGIWVLVGQELGIDVEYGVQVEAADVEH